MPSKPVLIVLTLMMLALAIPTAKLAHAVPDGAPVVGTTPIPAGATTTVSFSYSPEAGDAILSASSDVGIFIGVTFDAGEATADLNGSSITFSKDSDNDPLVSGEATFQCTSAGTTTFTLKHASVSTESETLECEVSTTTGGFIPVVTASPNVLFCGGTTVITATLTDALGNLVTPLEDFHFATAIGTLVETGPNSATLTLLPANSFSVVTATVDGASTAVVVQNFCSGNPSNEGFVAVVVTANPNVVACNGSSVITASARDAAGHVVKGVGFHFSVDNGVLQVGPPPTAEAEQATALLTILPGMPSATVLVSVGDLLGTVEGQVTVQNYCPSSAQTPGPIVLKASAPDVFCGTQIFLAATVKDAAGNPAPDGTPISFLTNNGVIEPAVAQTFGGTLNVLYRPNDGIAGIDHITAAGGASFGYLDLEIKCGEVTQIVGNNSGGVYSPMQVPHHAAGSIRPPNTGSGGLLSSSD